MAEIKESIRYPIGIQTFSKIIEGGYRYVDKTMYIARLLKEGEYYFLSRPRRFGKSLLLSTLHSFFAGERHLFRNLAIDAEETDRLPSPVFHFDFNAGMYMEPRGCIWSRGDSRPVFTPFSPTSRASGASFPGRMIFQRASKS